MKYLRRPGEAFASDPTVFFALNYAEHSSSKELGFNA